MAESPSPTLPHLVGKGDLLSYFSVNMTFFPLHSVEGEEVVGRRGRIWASKSPSPQINPPDGNEPPPGGLKKLPGKGREAEGNEDSPGFTR